MARGEELNAVARGHVTRTIESPTNQAMKYTKLNPPEIKLNPVGNLAGEGEAADLVLLTEKQSPAVEIEIEIERAPEEMWPLEEGKPSCGFFFFLFF